MAQRGVNKVIIVGNLGKDPETRYFSGAGCTTTFVVATSEVWKDKQSGEKQERTEWHRIATFNRLAEVAGEYLRKGAKVYIEGKLQTRKWQDSNGQDRYTTEVVAHEMQMLDGKKEGGAPPPAPPADQAKPAAPSAAGAAGIDPDEDIPFAPVHWAAAL